MPEDHLDRQIDGRAEAIGRLARMLAVRFGDVQTSLDRVEALIGSLESTAAHASKQMRAAPTSASPHPGDWK
jgi:hypothetical protein